MNPARWKTTPTPDQVLGTELLCSREACALFDTMGFGKSKQLIDAAGELYLQQEIDTVLLSCPASLKFNWVDPELGQLAQHSWVDTEVHEFVSEDTVILSQGGLLWVVVSYELGARGTTSSKSGTALGRVLELVVNELQDRRVLYAADESHWLKNHKSLQTRAWTELRRQLARRAVIMTGTPMGNGYLLDLFSQYYLLNPKILNYQNYYHMRARHCWMGGWQNKQIWRWYDPEVVMEKTQPYTLRRTRIEGLEEKRREIHTVPLTLGSWLRYKQMRDECLVWLSSTEASVAEHAFTRVLRLSQLTSGLLGGVDDTGEMRELSQEKVDHLVGWLRELEDHQESTRFILWCRFRQEIHRLCRVLQALGRRVFPLLGGQPGREREAALREFMEGDPGAPALLVAQIQAGGLGNSYHRTCSRAFFVSNGTSLIARAQAEDRIWRRGQQNTCCYWDLLATGPQGQRTIDHTSLTFLRRGIDLNQVTAAQWREELMRS